MEGCVIPSGSPRATTRRPGGRELCDVGRRLPRKLPPGRRAVGRCQADGMTHELQRGWAEQTRSERPTSVRHVPARASTNAHVRTHGPVQDVTGQAEVSTFTPKRSLVRSQYRPQPFMNLPADPFLHALTAAQGVHSRVGRGVRWLRVWEARGCR